MKVNPLNDFSHHAYLLVGDPGIRDDLIAILEKTYKIIQQGNPDLYVRNYETFTIDDSREIKTLHNSRPTISANKENIGAGKKIFILTMNGITIEAQNSLLKLLEEPNKYAHFFLIIPSAHLLLPTVKSRLSVIDSLSASNRDSKSEHSSKEISPELLDQARIFLKSNVTRRLEIVKKIVEDISKEKKTKQDAIDLLNAVESVIYEGVVADGKSKDGLMKNKKALYAISLVRNYIHDRAPSVKMLLEYMALEISN